MYLRELYLGLLLVLTIILTTYYRVDYLTIICYFLRT